MKDIDKMLKEAETGKQSQVFSRITEEAMPFWQGCEDRIKSGHKLKPYVVHRLLREEYDIKISESAIRKYFIELAEQHGK
jgi:hypothetical protein|tara:strand:- start:529 stop:768 length:240 start_codon:yes stop_codon:yes gene_type:complete